MLGRAALDGRRQQEGMERHQLQGSPVCLAALKIPSAPLGSDSGEKSALPVMQQGTDEALRQQGKHLSVKELVDH